MTQSTCCQAPVTYQGIRLITDPATGDFKAYDEYTCDGCGEETETFEEETEEDRREQAAEYWMDSERNGDN